MQTMYIRFAFSVSSEYFRWHFNMLSNVAEMDNDQSIKYFNAKCPISGWKLSNPENTHVFSPTDWNMKHFKLLMQHRKQLNKYRPMRNLDEKRKSKKGRKKKRIIIMIAAATITTIGRIASYGWSTIQCILPWWWGRALLKVK